jgi:type 1 fimbria pilin
MKKLLHTSITGVLIGCAFPAFAASTVDLAVTGLIVPSACTPTLSASTVDVGRVSVKDLNQDSRTFLTPTTLTLSVNCEASTLFAMKATDNRSDSAAAINELGIGKTAAGELIGGYWLMLSNATADTTAVQMIGSTNNGGSWFRFREDDAWGTTYLLSIAAVGAGSVPIPARDTQVALSVKPFIHAAKDVTIGEDTLIDGSATIEVKYL